ncbi:MAG: methionyl-tRNA formyltransferase [Flavobacteriales bacterium]
MRVVFMGTPDFAVPSLEGLLQSRHEVAGVVSNPDRPSGRGRRKKPSPVKELALEHGLPLLQPENLEEPVFLQAIREMKPDIQVVVAFRMLPGSLLDLPPYGSINLHASLLPAYRGAAPIQRALMEGVEQSGVTTFFIDEGMDQGHILLQKGIEIPADMTAGELHDRLAELGRDVLLDTLEQLEKGSLIPTPQKEPASSVPKAPKIGPSDRKLDWTGSATRLHDRIRAMSPSPGIQSELRGKGSSSIRLKILKAEPEKKSSSSKATPGTVLEVRDDRLVVATGDGELGILQLQPAGKRSMSVEAFLRGYRVEAGDRFL